MIEEKIIEECRGGNLKNFRKLVELTSPIAFSIAFRMLGDEDLARDVVQETMVTIWQKLNKIKSPEVYRTWIYKVVINKCYDHLRYKKRNREHVADEKIWLILSGKSNSEKQVEELFRSIDQLKKEYKELNNLIEEDPELKKLIERKLLEITDNKIKL